MNTKVFVGNIPYRIDEHQLSEQFGQFGNISDVVIIVDRATKRSKGFGFITFDTEESAKAAIDSMHDQEIQGRKLVVKEALPPKERHSA